MAENHSTVAPDDTAAMATPDVGARPKRPGLDGIDLNNLPAGVLVRIERNSYIAFAGAESALIDGGIIHREWIVGLGRLTRRIVLDSCGAFVIVGEGLRGPLSGAQREFGAYGIKRSHDGTLRVSVFAEMEPHALFGRNGFINSDFYTPVAYLLANFWPMIVGTLLANVRDFARGNPWQRFLPAHEILRMHVLAIGMPFLALIAWALFGDRFQQPTIVVLMCLFYLLPKGSRRRVPSGE